MAASIVPACQDRDREGSLDVPCPLAVKVFVWEDVDDDADVVTEYRWV